MAQAMETDYRQRQLPPTERAMLDFAVKLTHAPASMQVCDVERLRAAGWDDVAIHDIVQVVSLFNYYNRLADGLGIDPEPEG